MLTLDYLQRHEGLYSIPNKFTVQRGVSLDYRIEKDLLRDDIFDFNVHLEKYGVDLQRPYVWEHYQANDFLISILLEKPFSDVVVIRHVYNRKEDKQKILVIDGKQRLLTIKKFLLGEISIEVAHCLYNIHDLSEDLRLFFNRRLGHMTATVYYSYFDMPITDDMKIDLFNFYNFSGTPQTVEHKQMLQNLLKS